MPQEQFSIGIEVYIPEYRKSKFFNLSRLYQNMKTISFPELDFVAQIMLQIVFFKPVKLKCRHILE